MTESRKKPDLLALPVARFSSETRCLTDTNCPGAEFWVTLTPPGPLDRARVVSLSQRYMEEYAIGVRGANGKVKEKPLPFPSLDGVAMRLDENLAAELGIMEGLQPDDADPRWNLPEIVLLISRAPDAFEDWREWAMSVWRRDNRGNSE